MRYSLGTLFLTHHSHILWELSRTLAQKSYFIHVFVPLILNSQKQLTLVDPELLMTDRVLPWESLLSPALAKVSCPKTTHSHSWTPWGLPAGV